MYINIMPPVDQRCFFIGFNKTATTSLHFYFLKNNISSIHHKNKHVALEVMKHNLKLKRPILSDLPYRIFLDFLNDLNLDIYKKIYKEHPEAKYVLQVRDKKKWVLSRLNFMNGNYVRYLNKKHNRKISVKAYIKWWSRLYDNHIHSVKEFFKEKPNFFVYNIDTTNFQDLLDFLEMDTLDAKLSKEYGKSVKKHYKLKDIIAYI